MRIIIAALLFLAGCAGARPYKTPCEVDVRVRLAGSAAAAHDYCRNELDSCPDTGCQDRDKTRAGGCAHVATGVWFAGSAPSESNFIVVQDDDANIGHELRHVWDRHCR